MKEDISSRIVKEASLSFFECVSNPNNDLKGDFSVNIAELKLQYLEFYTIKWDIVEITVYVFKIMDSKFNYIGEYKYCLNHDLVCVDDYLHIF